MPSLEVTLTTSTTFLADCEFWLVVTYLHVYDLGLH